MYDVVSDRLTSFCLPSISRVYEEIQGYSFSENDYGTVEVLIEDVLHLLLKNLNGHI